MLVTLSTSVVSGMRRAGAPSAIRSGGAAAGPIARIGEAARRSRSRPPPERCRAASRSASSPRASRPVAERVEHRARAASSRTTAALRHQIQVALSRRLEGVELPQRQLHPPPDALASHARRKPSWPGHWVTCRNRRSCRGAPSPGGGRARGAVGRSPTRRAANRSRPPRRPRCCCGSAAAPGSGRPPPA